MRVLRVSFVDCPRARRLTIRYASFINSVWSSSLPLPLRRDGAGEPERNGDLEREGGCDDWAEASAERNSGVRSLEIIAVVLGTLLPGLMCHFGAREEVNGQGCVYTVMSTLYAQC